MGRLEKAIEYKEMRASLEQKYGKAYFSALRKLSNQDVAYDEDGYLKSEYELTDEEKDALRCLVNNSDNTLSGGRVR